MNTAPTLTTGEIAARFGITLRSLQWWHEKGLVTPLQIGHQRAYSHREIVELWLIVELKKRQFSTQQITRLFRGFHHIVQMVIDARLSVYIVATRDSLDLFHTPALAINAVAKFERPVAVIKFNPEDAN